MIEGQLFRSARYRVVGGVCSGIALTRGYSILLTRIVTLMFVAVSGIGILAYFIGWALIPSAEGTQEPAAPHDPLRRRRSDKMVGGVCAGLAKVLNLDVAIVRIIFAVSVLWGGTGLIPYFYAWVSVPLED